MAAMDYRRPSVPVTGKKSWVFLDEAVIALGSDISLSSDHETEESVITVLNQVIYVGNHTSGGTGGRSTPDEVGDWLHHDQIGFVSLMQNQSIATHVQRKGNAFQSGIFSAWIDHGRHPKDDRYAYALLPDVTSKDTKLYSQNPPIKILSLDSLTHAVCDVLQKTVSMSFWVSACVEVSECLPETRFVVCSDKPVLAIIQVRKPGSADYEKCPSTLPEGSRKTSGNEGLPETFDDVPRNSPSRPVVFQPGTRRHFPGATKDASGQALPEGFLPVNPDFEAIIQDDNQKAALSHWQNSSSAINSSRMGKMVAWIFGESSTLARQMDGNGDEDPEYGAASYVSGVYKLISSLSASKNRILNIPYYILDSVHKILAKNSESSLNNSESFLNNTESYLKNSESNLKNSESYLKNTESYLNNSESYLNNSESNLKNSESNLNNSESNLNNSKSNLKNSEFNLKNSESNLKNSESNLNNSESNLNNSKSNLKNSESNLMNSGSNLKTNFKNPEPNLKNSEPNLKNSESNLKNPENFESNLNSTIDELSNLNKQFTDDYMNPMNELNTLKFKATSHFPNVDQGKNNLEMGTAFVYANETLESRDESNPASHSCGSPTSGSVSCTKHGNALENAHVTANGASQQMLETMKSQPAEISQTSEESDRWKQSQMPVRSFSTEKPKMPIDCAPTDQILGRNENLLANKSELHPNFSAAETLTNEEELDMESESGDLWRDKDNVGPKTHVENIISKKSEEISIEKPEETTMTNEHQMTEENLILEELTKTEEADTNNNKSKTIESKITSYLQIIITYILRIEEEKTEKNTKKKETQIAKKNSTAEELEKDSEKLIRKKPQESVEYEGVEDADIKAQTKYKSGVATQGPVTTETEATQTIAVTEEGGGGEFVTPVVDWQESNQPQQSVEHESAKVETTEGKMKNNDRPEIFETTTLPSQEEEEGGGGINTVEVEEDKGEIKKAKPAPPAGDTEPIIGSFYVTLSDPSQLQEKVTLSFDFKIVKYSKTFVLPGEPRRGSSFTECFIL